MTVYAVLLFFLFLLFLLLLPLLKQQMGREGERILPSDKLHEEVIPPSSSSSGSIGIGPPEAPINELIKIIQAMLRYSAFVDINTLDCYIPLSDGTHISGGGGPIYTHIKASAWRLKAEFGRWPSLHFQANEISAGFTSSPQRGDGDEEDVVQFLYAKGDGEGRQEGKEKAEKQPGNAAALYLVIDSRLHHHRPAPVMKTTTTTNSNDIKTKAADEKGGNHVLRHGDINNDNHNNNNGENNGHHHTAGKWHMNTKYRMTLHEPLISVEDATIRAMISTAIGDVAAPSINRRRRRSDDAKRKGGEGIDDYKHYASPNRVKTDLAASFSRRWSTSSSLLREPEFEFHLERPQICIKAAAVAKEGQDTIFAAAQQQQPTTMSSNSSNSSSTGTIETSKGGGITAERHLPPRVHIPRAASPTTTSTTAPSDPVGADASSLPSSTANNSSSPCGIGEEMVIWAQSLTLSTNKTYMQDLKSRFWKSS
eukprot:jgi/Bigna1/78745/fgenesh1_pg.56_\